MTTKELSGIAHELGFWKGFVQTDRFIKGWVADIPTPELPDPVKQFIHYNAPPNAKVLDVGSGVVSILNGLRKDIQLTAADPLGGLYALIFDYKRHRIAPPMPVPAEELDMPDTFDLVHCSNAIDHTQDPMLALWSLLNAVKPGGWLIVQGFSNEGSYENWQGFHQWNIDVNEEGYISIHNQQGFVSLFPHQATDKLEVILQGTEKKWFIFILQKK